MDILQNAKSIVRQHMAAFDKADVASLPAAGTKLLGEDFIWRSMYPFYEITGGEKVAETFWQPLRQSFGHLQRREDIFFAGLNDVDGGESVWTCSMGHFIGLFDADWLGIPKTGRATLLRYTEFMQVVEGRITQSAFFFDLLAVMHQAGVYPLPPMTGAQFICPGPKTHDGILLETCSPAESKETMDLVNRMIEDLASANHLTDYDYPPELLAKTWRDDMIWYGPCGIGTSYTIPRYQKQHQYPFRTNLADKTYLGHKARIAESRYCAFFGWPNLTNRNMGGFLGLPEATSPSEMRVVDVYRRDGDKLAENWVIIDIPHYLKQQGLDVLERMRQLRPGA